MARKPKRVAWYRVKGPDGVVHECFTLEEATALYDKLYLQPKKK